MCGRESDAPPYDLTATVPRCDAFLERVRAGGYGLELVPCQAQRGLVIVEDAAGVYRRACPAVGHLANVIRRFGTPEPAEPEWVLR
jgi:acyl CoA:acetate/3-ketoacid CoA transferase alpha subunit